MHSRFRTSHRKVIAGELLILRDFAPAEALDPADWLEEQGREHMQREPQVSRREAALFRLIKESSSLFAEYLAGSLESLR
jgi:hypothetical protein